VTDDFLLAAGAASREDFPPLDSLVGEEELTRVRERLRQGSGEPRPAEPPEAP
jgi:segregation and condensation protein B